MKFFPDFMIIGASRCGTTSLHMYMGEHPLTQPPKIGKELQYWNLHYDPKNTNIHFYEQMWEMCEDPEFLRYESSTDYFFEPQVTERVKEWIPNCKFIVLVRDPVVRAWSEYFNYWLRIFGVGLPQIQELCNEVRYDTPEALMCPYSAESRYRFLQKGMYVKSFRRWFEYFPREQFLILKAEEFFEDTQKTLDEVCDFLLLEHFTPNISQKHDPLRHPNRTYPKMPDDIRQVLEEFYCPYNQMLYELLRRDFQWEKSWTSAKGEVARVTA